MADTRFMTLATHPHEWYPVFETLKIKTLPVKILMIAWNHFAERCSPFILLGLLPLQSSRNGCRSCAERCLVNSHEIAFPGGTHMGCGGGNGCFSRSLMLGTPHLAVGNSPPVPCYSHLADNGYEGTWKPILHIQPFQLKYLLGLVSGLS